MKKAMIFVLVVCILCSSAGCSVLTPAEPVQKTFLLESYNLQIVADDTYYEKTGGSFDLQLTNENSYISIMVYRYSDLPESTTARDVYDIQNQDIFSKRDAVAEMEKTETFSLPQGEAIRGAYTAKRDGLTFPKKRFLPGCWSLRYRPTTRTTRSTWTTSCALCLQHNKYKSEVKFTSLLL